MSGSSAHVLGFRFLGFSLGDPKQQDPSGSPKMKKIVSGRAESLKGQRVEPKFASMQCFPDVGWRSVRYRG